MKLIVLLFLITTLNVHADGILFSKGKSSTIDENIADKIGYLYEVKNPWGDLVSSNLFLNWEASYFVWENKYGDDITGGAIIPLIGYSHKFMDKEFYIRAGVGVAYLDQTRWGNRHLGDNWTFEDKIDFGVNLHKHSNISFSLTHYSNAATNKNNDGVNIFSLNYTFKW
jgi:hypothetical protein